MKKISKLAVLLASGALLFGGLFLSCSDDDDGGNNNNSSTGGDVSVTLDKTELSLAAGKTETLTATVANATNTSVEWSSSDKDIATVDGGTVTAVAEGSATITATSIADNTKSASCTVTVTKGSGNQEKATAKTYDFTGLKYADLSSFSLVATYKESGASSTTDHDISETNFTTEVNAASGTAGFKDDSITLGGATLKGKLSKLRFRFDKVDGSYTTASSTSALNYNGGLKTDISSGVTISDLDRYVSIPVDGAGTVSASIKAVGSSGKTGNLQIGLFDSNGKLLGDLVTAAAGDGKITGTDSNTGTVSGTVTAATTVYLVFSRNGAEGGGLDVKSIVVSPTE